MNPYQIFSCYPPHDVMFQLPTRVEKGKLSMGYMLTLTKVDRTGLPQCHEDFQDRKVWQHWVFGDDDEVRCNAEVVYEGRNKYTVRDVFRKPLEAAGADFRYFPYTEVSKEALHAVDVELEALCSKISEALARDEQYCVNFESYDSDGIIELQEFRPILLKLIGTFDFDQHALIVDWS